MLEASERLSSAKSSETTLGALADSLVPGLADGCMVRLASPTGNLELTNIAYVDSAMEARLRKLGERGALTREIASVFQTGASVLVDNEEAGGKRGSSRPMLSVSTARSGSAPRWSSPSSTMTARSGS